MNGLRVALLFLGIAVIALIYYFGIRGRKQRARPFRRHYDDIKFDVSALSGSGEAERLDDASDKLNVTQPAGATPRSTGSDRLERRPDMSTLIKQVRHSLRTGVARQQGVRSAQRIVSLYLTAPEGYSYEGAAIREALETVGMHHGEMGIFHHFGVEGMSGSASLFSLANMVEPGSFELNRIDQMTTPGLVFFMQVPTVFDPEVVFELMLHTAQRLCELLGGELKDENRNVLEPGKLDELRKLIAAA